MTEPEFSEIPLNRPQGDGYVSRVEALATELMSATKAGDPKAFDKLTTRLRGRAFTVARSLVGSREDALELTQEAFLKTFRARQTYRDGEPFLPWFHRILRNTCFSFLRKQKRIKRHSLSAGREEGESDWEIEDDGPRPHEGVEKSEAMRVLWEGIHRLSARDREILCLRHFQDLPYREISQALDIPEGTVMSRLFHARRRLRELLAPHLDSALEDYAPTPAEGIEN